MKELSIEEKGKAYDKVREKIALRFGDNVAEEIFSQFEESEDEKIRKELCEDIWNSFPYEKAHKYIAWLEKQGQTFTKKDVDDAYLKGVCDTKQELEKQGEQKTDKYEGYCEGCNNVKGCVTCVDGDQWAHYKEVEQKPAESKPKFKVGDMVCKKKDNSFCATINSITDTVYLCDVFDSDGDYDDDYAFLISEQDEYELVAKRVEPQLAWSEEDESVTSLILAICNDYKESFKISPASSEVVQADIDRVDNWLKSIKGRVLPHNAATTKGRAIRAYEFLEKHKNDTPIVYVVTRCEEHSDYVEKVFFDGVKAEDYCKQFEGDENQYGRDITKVEVTV